MRTLLFLAAAFAICPCATIAQSSLSANPSFAPNQSGTFRPGDSFGMRLSGMPAEDALLFKQVYTVGADGYLSIPLVGQIKAAGLTQSQLERAIERKLIDEEIFRFPTATIGDPRHITVGGQVRNPNRLPPPANAPGK